MRGGEFLSQKREAPFCVRSCELQARVGREAGVTAKVLATLSPGNRQLDSMQWHGPHPATLGPSDWI